MMSSFSRPERAATITFLAAALMALGFAVLPHFSFFRMLIASCLVIAHGIFVFRLAISKRALWWETARLAGALSLGIYFFYLSIFVLLPLPNSGPKAFVAVFCLAGSVLVLQRGFHQQKTAIGLLTQEWARGSHNPLRVPDIGDSSSFFNKANLAIASVGTLPVWIAVYLSYRIGTVSPRLDNLVGGVAGFFGVFYFAYFLGKAAAILSELLSFETRRGIRVKLASPLS